MLKLLLVIGGFIVVIGVLLVVAKYFLPEQSKQTAVQEPESDRLEYDRRKWLLTKAEFSLYRVLEQVVGSELIICPKVRLADVIAVKKGADNWQKHQNRIQSKHVDFVLCTPDTIEPRVVIELNDASHDRDDRKKRDAFVERALAAAGLPFVAIRARQGYVPAEVKAAIKAAMANT